jgi:hypothetical protein
LARSRFRSRSVYGAVVRGRCAGRSRASTVARTITAATAAAAKKAASKKIADAVH